MGEGNEDVVAVAAGEHASDVDQEEARDLGETQHCQVLKQRLHCCDGYCEHSE